MGRWSTIVVCRGQRPLVEILDAGRSAYEWPAACADGWQGWEVVPDDFFARHLPEEEVDRIESLVGGPVLAADVFDSSGIDLRAVHKDRRWRGRLEPRSVLGAYATQMAELDVEPAPHPNPGYALNGCSPFSRAKTPPTGTRDRVVWSQAESSVVAGSALETAPALLDDGLAVHGALVKGVRGGFGGRRSDFGRSGRRRCPDIGGGVGGR